MNTPFTLKWETHGTDAEDLVSRAVEHLDKRKKNLKDDTINREVVTAILAHRRGPFEVRYTHLPKTHKEAVREAVESLCGPVLTQEKGASTYALRSEFRASGARFITKAKPTDGKRVMPTISTIYGTVYRDGTHDEVPFEDIALLGFTKPSLVTVEAPHHHWHIFVGDTPPPAKNWQKLEEVSERHPDHETIMELVENQIWKRGVVAVRYGENGFLTINPDAVAFILDATLVRFSGRSGQRPLLTITDTYGRQHIRWGNKA
jgi:hypothetical protein